MAQQKKKKLSKPQTQETAPQKPQKPQRNPEAFKCILNFVIALICLGIAYSYYAKGDSKLALYMVLAGVAFFAVGGVHLYRSKKNRI